MMPKRPSPLERPEQPLLVVLSGPSGAGKDALLSRLKQSGLPIEFVTTVTTRPRRSLEKDGIDYHFISEPEFEELRASNGLLEHARVYGNWYGVPRRAIKEALARGRDTIVKVDVQGAKSIKKLAPLAVFIFVTPPSIEELARRLKLRNTETTFNLDLRIRTAEEELKLLPMFDYIVFNRQGEIDRAVADIKAIITAEKCCVQPREVRL